MKFCSNLYVEKRALVPIYFVEKEESKRYKEERKGEIKERSMNQMVV